MEIKKPLKKSRFQKLINLFWNIFKIIFWPYCICQGEEDPEN